MDKKKRTIILIVAAVLVLGFAAYMAIDAQITARRREEEEQRKREVVMEVLAPFIERYGFTDMVCNEADDSSMVSAVVTSESFGEASDEVKLAFLADVEYFTEHQPMGGDHWMFSRIARHGLNLKVISGEYSYTETVASDWSELRRADAGAAYVKSAYSPYKEVILRMETLHAKDVEASLEELLAKEKCYLCNGTGSVKYYYGDSALEALVNGHEDSWYGQCGVCGGKGYIRD